jgi:hypothetical protein
MGRNTLDLDCKPLIVEGYPGDSRECDIHLHFPEDTPMEQKVLWLETCENLIHAVFGCAIYHEDG